MVGMQVDVGDDGVVRTAIEAVSLTITSARSDHTLSQFGISGKADVKWLVMTGVKLDGLQG